MKFNKEQIQTLQIYARRDVRGNNFLNKKIPEQNLQKILLCTIYNKWE